MRPRPLLLLLLGFSACSSLEGGGLKATVRFFMTDAQCAKVFVTGSNNLVVTSGPLLRGTRDKVVGIAQDSKLGATVNVQAKGFRAADCSGDVIDESELKNVEFSSGEVDLVLLVLKGGMSPSDAGPLPDAGPLDDGGMTQDDGGMKDDGGLMLPDAGPEQCGNGIDDDRDGLTDCFDGDCLQQDCLFGRRCTSIGVCAVPLSEVTCNDGLDDDGDGKADCLDDDCNAKSCADSNVCTFAETCVAKVCTPSVTLTCMSPRECQLGAGTCLADAGCGYAAKTGSCDGGTCMNGECILGFPYTPSNSFDPALPATAISSKIRLDCGVSTFNSDTLAFGNWCSQAQPTPRIIYRFGVQNIVVLPMAGLEVINELRLTGSQPVLFAVYGDARIAGKLVASGVGSANGPGGPAGNCLFQGEPGFTFIFSGGGGGGAGFAQAGTKGGNVSGNGLAGGLGGATFPMTPAMQLRGGCAGGDGASGMMGQQAALGGGAGGALQLSVSGTLTIEGFVSANGGGGAGGVTFNAGGGGGGSGGGILLEANLLQLLAGSKLTANGGGGGGGARLDDDGNPGVNGRDDSDQQANGGSKGGGQASDGAKGGALTPPGVAQDSTTSAAGGGGGGTGRIHLRSVLTCVASGSNRIVSPAATGDCP